MGSKVFTLVLLFIVSQTCCVASSTYKAVYIKKNISRNSGYYSLNAGISICSAILLFFLNGFDCKISTFSILLGCLFGVVVMASSIIGSVAIKLGPYGYTVVIMNMSTAITSLSGFLFWGESISPFQIVGICLMLVCFYLSIDIKNTEGKKASFKWFILCIVCLLVNALMGLIQKYHQESEFAGELIPFLCIAFVVGGILSAIVYSVLKKKEARVVVQTTEKITFKALLPIIIAILICGVGIAANNVIDLYLIGEVPATVFFPIANGVPLISSLLVSFFLFKEKLLKRQKIGLCVGIVAIVCLFF